MEEAWPPIGEEARPTIAALHLYSQVVGKIAVAIMPWVNHGWQVTYRVTPRGLRTQMIHGPGGAFELEFDLVGHRLLLVDLGGEAGAISLRPSTCAAFYDGVMTLLRDAGHPVAIHPMPNEIDPATPFVQDYAERAYDPSAADAVHRALISAHRLLSRFRTGFLGKVSPVQFFWGSFDLAVTRFSGRRAPLHPGGIPNQPDEITREAYSHEVSSAGFWPGGVNGGAPFFYSYAYPSPDGFADAAIRPDAARYDTALGEFVLDYEAVRRAPDPDAAVMDFLTSSYEAAANLSRWDRDALECGIGKPGVPRAV